METFLVSYFSINLFYFTPSFFSIKRFRQLTVVTFCLIMVPSWHRIVAPFFRLFFLLIVFQNLILFEKPKPIKQIVTFHSQSKTTSWVVSKFWLVNNMSGKGCTHYDHKAWWSTVFVFPVHHATTKRKANWANKGVFNRVYFKQLFIYLFILCFLFFAFSSFFHFSYKIVLFQPR